MCVYPELTNFLEGFTNHYTNKTTCGAEVMVTEDEFKALSEFLVSGIVDWVEVTDSGEMMDRPALGEFLEDFAEQYLGASDVGMAVQVTEEEMIGLGLFLVRGFVGWVLRLDQNRGRFKGFEEVIANKRLSLSGPVSRRSIVRAR